MNKTLTTLLAAGVALLLARPGLVAQNVQRIVRIVGGPEPAPAEPKEASRPAVPRSVSATPIFHLRDRSKVAGVPKAAILDVETRYGVLHIPCEELRKVQLVERIDAALAARVRALVAQLGDEDFDRREAASEELRKAGPPALPLLRAAAESRVEEVQARAEALVEEIEADRDEKGSAPALPHLKGKFDEIVTTRMTVKGRVLADHFTIVSRYGTLEVDTADILAITFQEVGPSARSFDVLPKFQPPGNWLDTKLELEKGREFRLQASGILSVSNYSVSCGPTGTRQWGGTSWSNFPQLSLVGRVGKKGKPFLVGNEYKGKADRAGRLQLAIVAFSYNPGGAIGKYRVKFRPIRKD